MRVGYTEARHATFTVIDFETTGVVTGYPVEPWQIGMVRIERGIVSAQPLYETLLHVGERPFNPHAPGRHAQLRHELAAAPTPAACWPELLAHCLNTTLVAHNAGTERTILTRLAPLHHFGAWVDTLKLARHAFPQLASHALEELIVALRLQERLSALCPARAPHDALYDAFAAALLLEYFLALPSWQRVTVEALTQT